MSARMSIRRHSFSRTAFARLIFGGLLALGTASATAAEPELLAEGRELFMREWLANDVRSHKGDGLGPVFNDTSCVACHNQGGVGGSGPAAKNAQLVTAFSGESPAFNVGASATLFGALVRVFGANNPPREAPAKQPEDERPVNVKAQRQRLAKIHPEFGRARSVVLHRFSTSGEYGAFRAKLSGIAQFGGLEDFNAFPGAVAADDAAALPRLAAAESIELNRLKMEAQFQNAQFFGGGAAVDSFVFVQSERNTIPLFGSGTIDAIPDKALLAAAERKFDDYPDVSGRVAKLKDGQLGRFGWKAQTAHLDDFVLTACAVELGLEVPGKAQSGLPHKPAYKAPGLDLTEHECNALIAFVGTLPAPGARSAVNDQESNYLAGGRKLFASAGCAACHVPQLGEVTGIYSDLLLHDMGQELSDSGSYSGFAPNSTEDEELQRPLPPLAFEAPPAGPIDEGKLIGATRQEWRTPPLWGVRDSAPYLHDGRAATLEQAIVLHGGEGTRAVHNYIKLSAAERLQLTTFLRSLMAPAAGG